MKTSHTIEFKNIAANVYAFVGMPRCLHVTLLGHGYVKNSDGTFDGNRRMSQTEEDLMARARREIRSWCFEVPVTLNGAPV